MTVYIIIDQENEIVAAYHYDSTGYEEEVIEIYCEENDITRETFDETLFISTINSTNLKHLL